MDFCKECGSRFEPKKIKSGKQTMLVLVCSKCGEKTNQTNETKINSKIMGLNPKNMVSVIDKEKQLRTLPTIRFTCLRCRNNNAYAWQVQTRGADESSTQFLRCTSCGYTFRECT
jgi:transcription factor S